MRQIEAAADHELRHLILVGVRRHERSAIGTVAQHRYLVRNREDLVHTVRNIDDADALIAQVVYDVEQYHLFGIGQRGRRLVEDHRLGIDGQGAGNLDHLLVGDGQVADDGLRRERAFQAFQDRGTARVQRLPVDAPETQGWQLSEIDVFGHRQFIGKAQFLMNEHHALALGVERRGHHRSHLFDEDLALVGLVYPAEHLHQGRFSGTVLAQQGVNLAGHHLKRHAVQGADPRKRLDDILQSQRGRTHIRSSPLPFRFS